jgi:hypothetical protein
MSPLSALSVKGYTLLFFFLSLFCFERRKRSISNIDEDRVVSEIRGDAEESFDDVPFLVRFHLNACTCCLFMPRLLVRHWRSFSPHQGITYVLTSNSGSLVDGFDGAVR